HLAHVYLLRRMLANEEVLGGIDVRHLSQVSGREIAEELVHRDELCDHLGTGSNLGEVARQWPDEEARAVVVSPGDPTRLELAEDRRRGHRHLPDDIQSEPVARPREGIETVGHGRSE